MKSSIKKEVARAQERVGHNIHGVVFNIITTNIRYYNIGWYVLFKTTDHDTTNVFVKLHNMGHAL
jgi:hypothetical protein